MGPCAVWGAATRLDCQWAPAHATAKKPRAGNADPPTCEPRRRRAPAAGGSTEVRFPADPPRPANVLAPCRPWVMPMAAGLACEHGGSAGSALWCTPSKERASFSSFLPPEARRALSKSRGEQRAAQPAPSTTRAGARLACATHICGHIWAAVAFVVARHLDARQRDRCVVRHWRRRDCNNESS